MDRRSKHKSYKYSYQAPDEFYKYPKKLNTVIIDGERTALGPIILSIIKQRNITQQSILHATGLDRRTFRDFLYDKPTPRNIFGPAAISQIMKSANIHIEDIISEVRAQRSAATDLN